MALYPSLEDMKVDQLMKAQLNLETGQQAVSAQYPGEQPPSSATAPPYPVTPTSVHVQDDRYAHLYPQLEDYMGLHLADANVAVAVVPARSTSAAIRSPNQMVAPLSGNSAGLLRSQVSHGIREVLLCKDGKGKVGLRLQAVNNGVFVILVQKNTPAALAGLRFGDQILMINDVVIAGYTREKVHNLIKKADPKKITMVIRDRPFERTVTVHKDSAGHVGFEFREGRIANIVKDSSAARNGLLTDHHMLEVNGQNVVGLSDKEVKGMIQSAGQSITVTVMPSSIYDHLIKNTAFNFLKKTMDHSIPDI